MEIRRLVEADWEAYRALRLESLRLAPEAFGSDYEESSGYPPEYWVGRLAGAAADAFILGAFSEGNLVGMAAFNQERRRKVRHKGTITGVFVSPAFRGRGVARQLLTVLLDTVRRLPDLEQVTLCVVTENLHARDLYLKAGFEVFGTEPRALKVGGRYLDEDYMVLMLGE